MVKVNSCNIKCHLFKKENVNKCYYKCQISLRKCNIYECKMFNNGHFCHYTKIKSNFFLRFWITTSIWDPYNFQVTFSLDFCIGTVTSSLYKIQVKSLTQYSDIFDFFIQKVCIMDLFGRTNVTKCYENVT